MTAGNQGDCIAIIGGGFSGIVSAWRLARSARFHGRVVLVEGERPFGAAYATDSPWHVLNTPAGQMSALPEVPDHFLRFAARETGHRDDGAYLPRRLYRRYLATLRDEAIAHGVVCKPASARRIRRAADAGFAIDCTDGTRFTAREVVLAVGAGAPSVPRVLAGLRGQPGFFADPWAEAACVPPAGRGAVALIGTGQTAVDVALDLVRRGHRGPIVAVSRHGLLPGVRERGRAPTATIDFERMPTDSAVAAQRWWRNQVAAFGCAQAAHAALRPESAACWQKFAPPVRARLLRHARAHWDIGRHRLAPAVAARLDAIRESGQLQVRAARIRGGNATPDGFTLDWRRRGRGERIESQRFTRVINCTGFGGLDGAAASPLLRQLLADGLVQPGAHGLGVTVRDGDRLYVLGALQRCRYWESTAVPELAGYCRELAYDIEARSALAHLPAFVPTQPVATMHSSRSSARRVRMF